MPSVTEEALIVKQSQKSLDKLGIVVVSYWYETEGWEANLTLSEGSIMELFTVGEAAKAIGITPIHTRRLLRRGKLKGIKFGREWIIEAQSVKGFKPRKRRKARKGG